VKISEVHFVPAASKTDFVSIPNRWKISANSFISDIEIAAYSQSPGGFSRSMTHGGSRLSRPSINSSVSLIQHPERNGLDDFFSVCSLSPGLMLGNIRS
jgi:hypothetical protein